MERGGLSAIDGRRRSPKKAEGGGERGAGAAALAPFVPYLDRPDIPREPWVDVYLAHLAEHGGAELAAAAAGVSSAAVRDRRASDGVFAEEFDAALEYFKDLVEWQCLGQGRNRNNVLAFFARLKAERPLRYVEKQITVSVDAGVEVSHEQARAVLADLLAHITPSTRVALEAGHLLDDLPVREAPPA